VFKNINENISLIEYLFKNNSETKEQKDLRELSYKTFGNIANMQVTPEQSSFLSFLIKIGNYKNILELGTFMGYSTLAMAIAVGDSGHVTSVDKDIKTTSIAANFWKSTPYANKISLINGDAKIVLQNLTNEQKIFDFIFIDADKSSYKYYFETCLNLMADNGLIVFDNVLWKGKVFDQSINDSKTKAIREFNNFIKNDKRITTTMISIGDGMTLCKKKQTSRL
jgi:predicted O-methyltransferase YrrM